MLGRGKVLERVAKWQGRLARAGKGWQGLMDEHCDGAWSSRADLESGGLWLKTLRGVRVFLSKVKSTGHGVRRTTWR